MTSRPMLLGIAAGMLAALIWGGGAVVSRYLVLNRLDPIDLTFLRYVGCLPIAALLALQAPARAHLALDWWQTALLVLLAGPAYHLLLIYGYQFATAGAGALLVSGLLPILAMTIGAATGGPWPGVRGLSGALLVALGLVVFANPTGPGLAAATIEPIGVAVFVIGAMMWALLNHLVRRWRVSPFSLTIALALWSPLFLPFYLAFRPEGGLAAPWHEIVLQVVYHGVLVAFVGTMLFFYAVRLVGSEVAAFLQAAIPAIAATLGAFVLGEWIDFNQAVAIVLTVSGIALASLGYGAQMKKAAGAGEAPS